MNYHTMKKKLSIVLLLSGLCTLTMNGSTAAKPCSSTTTMKAEQVTTMLVPMTDGHALRYNFHKPVEDESWQLQADVAYRYAQSRHNTKTAALLFQNNPLTFQADSVNGKAANALVAENFGFEDNTNATLTLNPKIQTHTIDVGLTLGLNNLVDGLYVHVGVPVQNARYKMEATSKGTLGSTVDKGLYSAEYVGGTDPVSNFFDSTNSSTITSPATLQKALGGAVIGDMKARRYGIFNFASDDKCSNEWGVADVHLQLGWDAWKRESSHVGVYAHVVVPTGTHIDAGFAKYVFSPIVGNGRHWEVGAGLSAHADVWSSEDRLVKVSFDGYAAHMFSVNQFRYFDLTNRPMSRYALVKAFDSNLVYQSALYNVADISGQYVDVAVPLKGEFVVEMAYKARAWEAAFGYAFAGQQEEKVTGCDKGTVPSLKNTNNYSFALMGYAGVQAPSTANASDADTQWVTNLVQPDATAYFGGSLTTTLPNVLSGGNPEIVFGVPVALSNILTPADIDLSSGLMKQQIIHRLFANLAYTWENCSWLPTLGVMGSIGFSPLDSYTPEMWDVGIRFGITY